MTNHVHLLLTPPSAAACSGLMKQLGQRYAQYFNRAYGRSGPVWDPVDARMVGHPALYTWSSYRANALGKGDRLVTPHPELLALGLDATAQQRAYAALVDQALDSALVEEIRAATRGGYPMGSDPNKPSGV